MLEFKKVNNKYYYIVYIIPSIVYKMKCIGTPAAGCSPVPPIQCIELAYRSSATFYRASRMRFANSPS
jgi:hypothetical protein